MMREEEVQIAYFTVQCEALLPLEIVIYLWHMSNKWSHIANLSLHAANLMKKAQEPKLTEF